MEADIADVMDDHAVFAFNALLTYAGEFHKNSFGNTRSFYMWHHDEE